MMAILLGMALGGMFATHAARGAPSWRSAACCSACRYTVIERGDLLVAYSRFALVALYGMGMMFASIFLLFGREGWHLVNLAQEPVYLLSGTYFPVSGLQRLGGGGRLDHSADAGAGRHPAARRSLSARR